MIGPARRAPRLAARGLLLLGGLLFGIGSSELALRLVGFSWSLTPERVQFGWPESLANLDARYVADRDLLWVRGDQPARLAEARRHRPDIVMLGDSCTEFSDYPQRLIALLSSAHSGRTWRGLSMGTAGWSVYQGRRAFERDVVPLRPRVATFYFGWNDHWLAFGRPDAAIARQYGLAGSLWSRLRLVQLLEKNLLMATPGAGERLHRVPLPQFTLHLEEIAKTSAAQGIIAVLITAPTSHQQGAEPRYLEGRFVAKLEDLIPLHQAYVGAVREVARRRKIALCDAAAEVEALPPARRQSLFRRDGIHLSGRGSHWMAASLHRCFETHGVVAELAAAPFPSADNAD